jgi:hypothetical protein
VLAAVGLPCGLGAALGTTGLVASFLYEVQPNDPVALTLPVMIFLSAALLAGYVPARKGVSNRSDDCDTSGLTPGR